MDAEMIQSPTIGIVVIGRNEGERLKQCLRSLPRGMPVIYVDSGSRDGSVEFAHSIGVTVIELDMSIPFTAARARNEGWLRLIHDFPNLDAVQFVDGDCEVQPTWLTAAAGALFSDKQIASVFGRRRERYPLASIYNRMCDDEWDVPVGVANSCGGDALFRVAALSAVNGYDHKLIAGEEPDLCLRLRKQGWLILRIDVEMTLHDAAIHTWYAWWRRSQRAGFAYANHVWKHQMSSDPVWVRQNFSISLWSITLLASTVLFFLSFAYGRNDLPALIAVVTIFLYLTQLARMFTRKRYQGHDAKFALASSALILFGKIPQFLGQLMFLSSRIFGRSQGLIEYKGAS